MPDTIQVIRVERMTSGDIDDGDFVAGDGEDFKVYQVVGDVFELTERTRIWVGPFSEADRVSPPKFYISEVLHHRRMPDA